MVIYLVFSLLFLLGLVVFILAIYISMRPEDFKVTRSASIAATPAALFEQVNDFHKWEAWSPWAKLDPNCKNTYEGPTSGVGAAFAWSGDHKVGEGSMKITQSRPHDVILLDLVFTRPFKAKNVTQFTFVPMEGRTVVTWTMSGKNNFVGKAIGLFMDCDKMVGPSFEKGLENLRSVVEGSAL